MKIIKYIGIAFLGIHISTSSSLNALEGYSLLASLTPKEIAKQISGIAVGSLVGFGGISTALAFVHEMGHYIAGKLIHNTDGNIYINCPIYPPPSNYLFNVGPLYLYNFNSSNPSYWDDQPTPELQLYFDSTGTYPRSEAITYAAGPLTAIAASLALFNTLEHSNLKNCIKRPLQIACLLRAHRNVLQFIPSGIANDATGIISCLSQTPLNKMRAFFPKNWNTSWGYFSLKAAIAGAATIGLTYLSYKLSKFLYHYLKKSTPTTDAQEQPSS